VLSVDEHGLTVSAPWRSSERRIVGVIRVAEAWVLRKLEAWSALPARTLFWAHGDTIKYLGRDLRLELREDAIVTLVTLQDDGCLQVAAPEPTHKESIKAAVIKWYRRHAQIPPPARRGRAAPVPVQREDALGQLQCQA